ncbi:hypothetical protein Tco_0382546 [Tanacetum coccineum]
MSLRNLIWFCVPIQLDDDDDGNIEDNEQLANAIQESLKPELPPRNNYGNVFPPLPWLCWNEHSTVRLTSRERDLKSVHMEYRHFRNDHYASQFQQSGSVETEGTRTNCFYASQSSSMAHKQFLTTHHLNTDPDAEQQGFLRATGTSPLHILCQHQLYKTLMSIGLQSLKITLSTLPLRDINDVSSFIAFWALTSVSVSRYISLTSQRLDGGANKNVKRRTTFNCCGISNPQTINNELPESSFALLRNTRSIHEELPESSYAHSPGILTNAESDVPVSYRGYRIVVASDIHLQLQDAVVGGGVPATGKHQLRNRRGHHNRTTDSGAMAQAIAPKIAATSVKVLWHQNCYGTTFRWLPRWLKP